MFIVITISKPQNLSVANVTSRSITLTWLAPKDGKDVVTNYTLNYQIANDHLDNDLDNNLYAKQLGNIYNCTITNLSK